MSAWFGSILIAALELVHISSERIRKILKFGKDRERVTIILEIQQTPLTPQ